MREVRVSLLAIDEADASSVFGLYTVFKLYAGVVPDTIRFEPTIVAPDSCRGSVIETMTGLPIPLQRRIGEEPRTDIAIIPSLFTDAEGEWRTGRHPQAVDWIRLLYAAGQVVCSSCTGALLLAETGLLDGREATQHWAFSSTFRRNFPGVRLNPGKVLVTAGDGDRLVMSGASAAWHDLVLYLVARLAGPAAARKIARFFLLQWHSEGQAPYIAFREIVDHGDAEILAAQEWLRGHRAERAPVERAMRHSSLAGRSFSRRFRKATGLTPIAYVQHLRVESAKEWLEVGALPVDEIAWKVGYEDAASFRRVFKRLTGMSPSTYRRKFRVIGVETASGKLAATDHRPDGDA
ncbi:MAG: helix-turn-helix domain-containing protein [Proteobacteria bacterium]|nr:MAG: helix-turn-helix domain-containing protein [Pseudomonadota bacterium]